MASQNDAIYSINQLDEVSARILAKELLPLDKRILGKVNKVISITGQSYVEALEYVVCDSPALWAKVYLGWGARHYQIPILQEGRDSKQLVLRLGRRLGKTDSMCVLILWYAYTQINKGENDQYNILILTPYETQIDLIFDRLGQLIDGSPLLKSLLTREIQHRKEITVNGVTSIIKGMTAGASSGNSGSNNTRGQRADVIIFDEVDYIGSSQITNAINIRNEAPERIKVIAASTPCGKHEEFYKWCIGSNKSYKPKQEDIDNFRFTEYEVETAQDRGDAKGNGWTEVYAPSVVNDELLKVNPDTNQTYLQDIKEELSELRYDQEVMSNFGDEQMGVYQKQYIKQAVDEGKRIDMKYINKLDSTAYREFFKVKNGPRILGVDWDKVQAGTTMVALELDKYHKNAHGIIEPKFKVLFRIEIPSSKFTYTNAVNKIVELNDIYDFDWIAIDRGYGEVQLEMLHKYGMQNPQTGLHEKTVGYQFGQKLEVRDPYTQKKDKKPLKPFMVNNSVIAFERGKIVLNPSDKLLIEQLESYRIKSISTTGIPSYVDENEHAVDALNLCLLIFEQKYGNLLKSVISSKVLPIGQISRRGEIEPERVLSFEEPSIGGLIARNRKSADESLFDRTSSFAGAGIGRGGFNNNRSRGAFTRGRF